MRHTQTGGHINEALHITGCIAVHDASGPDVPEGKLICPM